MQNTTKPTHKLAGEMKRLAGFVLVGGGGFIVHSSMIVLLTHVLEFNPVLSWFPAFGVAVLFTWVSNRVLTFRGMAQHGVAGEAGRYLAVQSFGAGLNFLVYSRLILSGWPYVSQPFLALVCGSAGALLFNYLALRAFVFNKEAAAQNPSVDTQADSGLDEIYYEHAMGLPFAQRAAIKARENMYRHFLQTMQPKPDDKIVDFGVSMHETDVANALEKNYPHPENITCVGLGDGEAVHQAYPQVSYVQIEAGAKLPFADHEFDIAYSNAVLEHVGSRAAREQILAELSRIAKTVYICVPNRWFPIEHHTAIPLLHYFPRLFRAFTRGGKLEHWSSSETLQFISKADIARVFAVNGLKPKRAWTGLWLGPFSSNLACWTPRDEA